MARTRRTRFGAQATIAGLAAAALLASASPGLSQPRPAAVEVPQRSGTASAAFALDALQRIDRVPATRPAAEPTDTVGPQIQAAPSEAQGPSGQPTGDAGTPPPALRIKPSPPVIDATGLEVYSSPAAVEAAALEIGTNPHGVAAPGLRIPGR